jgi:acyl carrier protein
MNDAGQDPSLTSDPAESRDFEDVAAEIKEIISEIIEIPLEELDCKAHLVDDLGIDSLLALEVLAALEKRFKIEVPEEELVQFTTIDGIIDVARERLASEMSP